MNLHKKFGPIASFWWGKKYTVSIASAELFEEINDIFDRPRKFDISYILLKKTTKQQKTNILWLLKSPACVNNCWLLPWLLLCIFLLVCHFRKMLERASCAF